MSNESVADEEILYRRVKSGRGHYEIKGGKCILSSQCFGDRNRRISVTRATLCDNNPQNAQEEEADAVVAFVTKDVCQIDEIKSTLPDKSVVRNVIQVIPRPIPENLAHAEIIADPDYTTSAFERMKIRMARLYNEDNKGKLVILPPELRQPNI